MAHCKKKKKNPEISTNRESNSNSNSANHDRSIAPHGVGSRGPLKGPWWGSRERSPPKLLGFSRFGAPARPIDSAVKKTPARIQILLIIIITPTMFKTA